MIGVPDWLIQERNWLMYRYGVGPEILNWRQRGVLSKIRERICTGLREAKGPGGITASWSEIAAAMGTRHPSALEAAQRWARRQA